MPLRGTIASSSTEPFRKTTFLEEPLGAAFVIHHGAVRFGESAPRAAVRWLSRRSGCRDDLSPGSLLSHVPELLVYHMFIRAAVQVVLQDDTTERLPRPVSPRPIAESGGGRRAFPGQRLVTLGQRKAQHRVGPCCCKSPADVGGCFHKVVAAGTVTADDERFLRGEHAHRLFVLPDPFFLLQIALRAPRPRRAWPLWQMQGRAR